MREVANLVWFDFESRNAERFVGQNNKKSEDSRRSEVPQINMKSRIILTVFVDFMGKRILDTHTHTQTHGLLPLRPIDRPSGRYDIRVLERSKLRGLSGHQGPPATAPSKTNLITRCCEACP